LKLAVQLDMTSKFAMMVPGELMLAKIAFDMGIPLLAASELDIYFYLSGKPRQPLL
jgi:hypothetical protein